MTDLTRMLLSSPSFSNFLDHLSANPTAIPTATSAKPEEQQDQLQIPKDISPYGNEPSNQQIGMAMIPEQSMDFSMLTLDGSYNYQPQVFVVDTTDVPAPIDASVLSGKTSNFVETSFESDDEKVEIPAIERPAEKTEAAEVTEAAPVDEDFESDPEFALYHSEPAAPKSEARSELDADGLSNVEIFGGLETEKVLSRYELVDATEEETSAIVAMTRIQRISDSIESVVSRLELLTMDL